MEKFKKTDKKSKKISEVISELQDWKEKEGDIEVVITNVNEVCFDGFGNMFVIKSATSEDKFLGIIRSDVVIKI